MFRKFWSRSAKYGQNRGFGRLQRSRGFLSSILGPTLSTSNNGFSPNLAATFRKGFSIIYCLRVISTLYVVCLHYLILRIDVVICHSPPKKTQNWKGSNTHLTQTSLQPRGRTAQRWSLHGSPRPGSFTPWSAICTTYGFGATWGQFYQSHFCLFPIQNGWNVPSDDRPIQPRL